MHVRGYDYYADKASQTVGLSRAASLIGDLRAGARNSVLLDNGDFLQGNPLGDYLAFEADQAPTHPMIAAMNMLGYDGSTLGNHEFNYGLPFLEHSLQGATFPFVLANLVRDLGDTPLTDTPYCPPFAMLDRQITDGAGEVHPIRIGIIGFIPPQIMQWERRHLEGHLHTRDILETAATYVPHMRENGADVVVALCHSGLSETAPHPMMENAAIPLAAIDGIDAVLCGHQHLTFPGADFAPCSAVDPVRGTLHGTPAVMAGFWGSHVGVIDLSLRRDDAGWHVAEFETAVHPISKRETGGASVASVPEQPAILSLIETPHTQTIEFVRQPVGHTRTPLHSYFATITPDRSVRLAALAQKWYVETALAGGPLADLPVLAAASPFKCGGRGGAEYYTDVPAGPLSIRHVADLYLYPNTIRAIDITGADLRDWLERSASLFNTITQGETDQRLLNPNFPSYNFDLIEGLTYQVDISQPNKFTAFEGHLEHPEARRIVDLRHDGRPVQDSDRFIIATNSYRANGGGNFAGANGRNIVFEGPDTNRDILIRYITEHPDITLPAPPPWKFAPLPDTSVLFQSGPKAAAHLDDLDHLRVDHTGAGEDGFHWFRLYL